MHSRSVKRDVSFSQGSASTLFSYCLLTHLHWFTSRSKYKLATIIYKSLSVAQPIDLRQLVHHYESLQPPRTGDQN